MTRRIQPAGRYAKALASPAGDGLAQLGDAKGGRIDRQLIQIRRQRLGDEGGDGCLGSPIDSGIGLSAAGGVTPARRARSFSNG